MTPINILWIEDNPIIEKIEEIKGIKYPSFKVDYDGEQFLSFKLFQHPEEVREYLCMLHRIEQEGQTEKLNEICPAALPDIVVFDYKLSDNLGGTHRSALQYNKKEHASFIRDCSPSALLKETFADLLAEPTLFMDRDDVLLGNYSSDEFKRKIGADTVQGVDDEFGLYCGLAIIRELKNYVTFGVPATLSKSDNNNISINSIFYEWLNSYDLREAIERPDKRDKSWNKIIDFTIPLLRKSILKKLESGKLQIDYKQLNAYSNGHIPERENDRILSCYTAYGKREFPLDGLFITDVREKRDAAIQEWATTILKHLAIDNEIIKSAIENSDLLWKTYITGFEDRLMLSEYRLREKELFPNEKKEYGEIRLRLGMRNNSTQIPPKGEISIHTRLGNCKDNSVIRLTLLHLVTRAAIEAARNSVDNHFYKEVSLHPNDYFNILYPIINYKEDVILPIHMEDSEKRDQAMASEKNWLKTKLNNGDYAVPQKEIFDFKKWITKGEESILRSIFFNDKIFWPKWI